MPRRPRGPADAIAYHVFNRAVRRTCLFDTPWDYTAFERVLFQGLQRVPVSLLAYCAMPNHWHLVVGPNGGGELSRFMQWMTGTHAQRWNSSHKTVGEGYVYQGRFKSVAIRSDRHLLCACRYVERNPLRAGLVTRAEDWRWSSLWRRLHMVDYPLLTECALNPVTEWVTYVNQPCTAIELAAAEEIAFRARKRGRPRKA